MSGNAKWVCGGLFALAALLTASPYIADPNPMRWGALAALVCLLWASGRVTLSIPVMCGLAFAGYAALSLAWTPDWREGLLNVQSIALLSLCFAFLASLPRRSLARAVSLVAAIAVVMSSFVHFFVPSLIHGGFGNENFEAEFLVIASACALLGFCWKDKRIWALCIAAALLGLMTSLHNGSRAEPAGIVGGIASLAVLFAWHRSGVTGVVALLFLGMATFALMDPGMAGSIAARADYAFYTFQMFFDYPVHGAGAGSFNYLYPFYAASARTMDNIAFFAGAAHNEPLQALAMYGLAGVLPIVAGLVYIGRRSRDTLRIGALGVVGVVAGLSAIGFPMQNPSTALLCIAALAIACPRDGYELNIGKKALIPLPFLAVLFGVTAWKGTEAAWHFTKATLVAAQSPVSGLHWVNKAYMAMPLDHRYRLQLMISIQSASNDKRVTLAPEAADRAWRVTLTASPYHPAALLARGLYLNNSGRWRGNPEMPDIVHAMNTYAPAHYETWLLTAVYRRNIGETKAAAEAIVKAIEVGGNIKRIKAVAGLLNMEISDD